MLRRTSVLGASPLASTSLSVLAGCSAPNESSVHRAASLVVSADANVKDVRRMLGPASASMTLDVYANLFAMTLMRSRIVSMRPSETEVLRRVGGAATARASLAADRSRERFSG